MIASDFFVCVLALMFGAGCIGVGILLGRAIERDLHDTGRQFEQLARADVGWRRGRR